MNTKRMMKKMKSREGGKATFEELEGVILAP